MNIRDHLLSLRSLLSVEQVSDLLGVHPITVYRWTKSGKMPAVRIGSTVRIDPNTLAQWLAARTA